MASKYHYTNVNERWVSIVFVVLVLAAGWLFVSGLGPDASGGKISENNLQGLNGASGFLTANAAGGQNLNVYTTSGKGPDFQGLKVFNKEDVVKIIANNIECATKYVYCHGALCKLGKQFDPYKPDEVDGYDVSANIYPAAAGISIAEGPCNANIGIQNIIRNIKGDECAAVADWSAFLGDRCNHKRLLKAESPPISLPANTGIYCIAAGCAFQQEFFGERGGSNRFGQVKMQIEVADLGDISTLEISSTGANGPPCGKGRKCSLQASACVWNNPNGPGLCRKNEARIGGPPAPTTTTTTTPPTTIIDGSPPFIYGPPDGIMQTIYPNIPFSLRFLVSDSESGIDISKTSATAKVGGETRCSASIEWYKDNELFSAGKLVEVNFNKCIAKDSDVGKTITLAIDTKNKAGLAGISADNIQVISRPIVQDSKKPRCAISFSSETEIYPDSSAIASVHCEDDYLEDNDLKGTLLTVRSEIVHGQTVGGLATVGDVDPINTNTLDQEFACDSSCRQKVFSGDQQGETFSISVTATDVRGNLQTFGQNFKVKDVTPPTCQIYYSTPGDLSQTIKLAPNSIQPVKLKCSDNVALNSEAKFYRAYVKTNDQEATDEFAVNFPSTSGEQVASIDLSIPADAKGGTQVLWYVSKVGDSAGNEANIPDYGLITVKDTIKPTISKTDTSRQVVYDGGKFSVFVTANDNADLGEVKIKARKQGAADYEDVQTLTIGGTNIWNLPLEITNSWYNLKKGDLSKAAEIYEWKIELKDKEGNQVATQPTGSFTLKAPCSVAKKAITYSDILPAGGGEYAPGEVLTVSGKFKNNYDQSYADCGGLTSAFFKYNASISVDGALKLLTGTTPAGSVENVQFRITIPQPRLPDNRKGVGVIAISGSASGSSVSGASFSSMYGGEDFGFGPGAGSSLIGRFLDPNSALGSGASILLPGDVVAWKINTQDVSGNVIETPESTFKIKDIEAPILRVENIPAKIKTGEAISLKACVRDWNRNNASLKTEYSVNGASGSGNSLGSGAATTTLKDYILQRIGGVEDCSIFSYSASSDIKENSDITFKFTGRDAVGNTTKYARTAKVMNPPTWTNDRTPKSASPMQKIIFSKYWKDDTSLKSAELWVSTGAGLQKVASSEFVAGAKEGWINFDYTVPKIAGLKKITWEMRVKDFYGNEGVIDPEVTVVDDKTPPEILQISQAANEVYSGWSNFIKVKARDDIGLDSAVLYVREPGEGFKFFTSVQMNGNLSEESLEWKNENLIEGNVQWYVEVEDLNGNKVKSETNSFLVKLQAAPVGVTAPTTTTSTSSTTTTTLPQIDQITTITTTTTTQPAGSADYILIGVVALLLLIAGLGYYFRDKIKEALGIKSWKTPAAEPEAPAQQRK